MPWRPSSNSATADSGWITDTYSRRGRFVRCSKPTSPPRTPTHRPSGDMGISPDVHRAAALYLDLLKQCLTRVLFPDRSLHHDLASTSNQLLAERNEGRDWPTEAETMVGL